MVRDQFEKRVGLPAPGAAGCGARLPGLVVPHLDFRVADDVYAHGYRALLESEPPEVYVILGVGHRSQVELNLDDRDFETPLGTAAVDRKLIKELRERAGAAVEMEPAGHEGEHSIEFVVVYLQALARMFPEFGGFTFVPILCGGMHGEIRRGSPEGSRYHAVADALRDTIAADGRRVCVLGSIDGAHVGPRFRHRERVDQELMKQIAVLDSMAWEYVTERNPEKFFEMFLANGNSQHFDGVGVLYLMMRLFGERARCEVVKYAQWFEPADASVVTLASAVFRSS